jgi:predicted DNA-binding antitoxin AbrB/MazE fold protein
VTVDASSDNYIESFRFEGIEGQEVNIEEGKENTIRVRVPYKTDIDSLKPIIKVSEGATVNPESGEINNFTDEVIYTVTAEDGTVRKYTVKVTVDTSSDNYIESFRFEGIEGQEVNIEEGKENTIRVKVPYNTDIDWLKPIIKVSEGATVDPESEETQDFSKPFVYVVTAADGSEREYTVHVEKELNSEKKILSFSFKELDTLFEADINEKGKTIEVTLPNGTDTTDLIAYFEASPEAVVKVGEIEQVSGKTRNNFTETVIYTVMAQDGSTEDYAVTVTVEKSSEKYIKEFGFDVPKAAGIIDEEKRTIYVTVPYGTELNGLKAVFRSSDYSTVMVGKTEQKSGVTENNFAEPVKYTVVAQDGSTREYIVTVSAALAGDKKMLDYNLKVGENNIKAMIDESSHKIILAVPHGTNLENLTASFIYVGKSITIGGVPQISGMTPNSFAENVVYTITAHDETTTDYTVIVTVK